MSFPIRQAHERLERNQKLAQDLLISGLLPIVGVLISASYIGFYTVPILIVILTYLYKVINILLDKEENIFLRLVKNIEETEKALNYFKKILHTHNNLLNNIKLLHNLPHNTNTPNNHNHNTHNTNRNNNTNKNTHPRRNNSPHSVATLASLPPQRKNKTTPQKNYSKQKQPYKPTPPTTSTKPKQT